VGNHVRSGTRRLWGSRQKRRDSQLAQTNCESYLVLSRISMDRAAECCKCMAHSLRNPRASDSFFFLVSYLIEYFVVRFMVGASEGDLKVRVAVRNANLVTHGVMFFATTAWLVFAYLRG